MARSSRHPREVRERAVALVWETQLDYGLIMACSGRRSRTLVARYEWRPGRPTAPSGGRLPPGGGPDGSVLRSRTARTVGVGKIVSRWKESQASGLSVV
jgi:hypothetical protein